MIRNTTFAYGSISKLLHWSISILIIVMLVAGLIMGDLDDDIRPTVYMLHKSTGMLILGLVCIRIIWTLTNPKPELPGGTPIWEQMLAIATHYCLYMLMFCIPLTGWLMSSTKGYHPSFYGYGKLVFPGVEGNSELNIIAHNLHTILAYAVMVLLVLHVAAALKHHFINKDNVLKRMLPGK